MKLYLVRHGVAYDHGDPAYPNDDDRPLTPKGRKQFRRAAAGLLELVDPPAVIITSPLPRAAETAAILQELAGSRSYTVTSDGLRPGGSFDQALADCSTQIGAAATESGENSAVERGVALVGHAPSLGLLGAWLILGDAAAFALELDKGGIACIAFDGLPEPGCGELEWLATSRMLRNMS
jgi:phosphohistidine phosphatase